ncbi:pyridoxamine 5-phosphate oxidase [Rathayibacter caricis DSM 15933]|uniref:Pyridoxamine 5-phosphate oxidase n=2 Tax=Rathayibacter caricis TaxID=110936 RepID=A0A2T4UPR7_9MICO|nr:pyridoxamine 5-phosphate oxidase [Rathayibacter caricis DSM 15933]
MTLDRDQETPMSTRSNTTLVELTTEECWRLARSTDIGRLAVIDHTPSTRGPSATIVPVNFLVHDGAIFFRSGPGSKMMDITQHPRVAFEFDGHRGRRFWSVVVHGDAHRLNSDIDIENSGIQQLEAFHDDDKNNFVRIDVVSITGRSFFRWPVYRLRRALRLHRARRPGPTSLRTAD